MTKAKDHEPTDGKDEDEEKKEVAKNEEKKRNEAPGWSGWDNTVPDSIPGYGY